MFPVFIVTTVVPIVSAVPAPTIPPIPCCPPAAVFPPLSLPTKTTMTFRIEGPVQNKPLPLTPVARIPPAEPPLMEPLTEAPPPPASDQPASVSKPTPPAVALDSAAELLARQSRGNMTVSAKTSGGIRNLSLQTDTINANMTARPGIVNLSASPPGIHVETQHDRALAPTQFSTGDIDLLTGAVGAAVSIANMSVQLGVGNTNMPLQGDVSGNPSFSPKVGTTAFPYPLQAPKVLDIGSLPTGSPPSEASVESALPNTGPPKSTIDSPKIVEDVDDIGASIGRNPKKPNLCNQLGTRQASDEPQPLNNKSGSLSEQAEPKDFKITSHPDVLHVSVDSPLQSGHGNTSLQSPNSGFNGSWNYRLKSKDINDHSTVLLDKVVQDSDGCYWGRLAPEQFHHHFDLLQTPCGGKLSLGNPCVQNSRENTNVDGSFNFQQAGIHSHRDTASAVPSGASFSYTHSKPLFSSHMRSLDNTTAPTRASEHQNKPAREYVRRLDGDQESRNRPRSPIFKPVAARPTNIKPKQEPHFTGIGFANNIDSQQSSSFADDDEDSSDSDTYLNNICSNCANRLSLSSPKSLEKNQRKGDVHEKVVEESYDSDSSASTEPSAPCHYYHPQYRRWSCGYKRTIITGNKQFERSSYYCSSIGIARQNKIGGLQCDGYTFHETSGLAKLPITSRLGDLDLLPNVATMHSTPASIYECPSFARAEQLISRPLSSPLSTLSMQDAHANVGVKLQRAIDLQNEQEGLAKHESSPEATGSNGHLEGITIGTANIPILEVSPVEQRQAAPGCSIDSFANAFSGEILLAAPPSADTRISSSPGPQLLKEKPFTCWPRGGPLKVLDSASRALSKKMGDYAEDVYVVAKPANILDYHEEGELGKNCSMEYILRNNHIPVVEGLRPTEVPEASSSPKAKIHRVEKETVSLGGNLSRNFTFKTENSVKFPKEIEVYKGATFPNVAPKKAPVTCDRSSSGTQDSGDESKHQSICPPGLASMPYIQTISHPSISCAVPTIQKDLDIGSKEGDMKSEVSFRKILHPSFQEFRSGEVNLEEERRGSESEYDSIEESYSIQELSGATNLTFSGGIEGKGIIVPILEYPIVLDIIDKEPSYHKQHACVYLHEKEEKDETEKENELHTEKKRKKKNKELKHEKAKASKQVTTGEQRKRKPRHKNDGKYRKRRIDRHPDPRPQCRNEYSTRQSEDYVSRNISKEQSFVPLSASGVHPWLQRIQQKFSGRPCTRFPQAEAPKKPSASPSLGEAPIYNESPLYLRQLSKEKCDDTQTEPMQGHHSLEFSDLSLNSHEAFEMAKQKKEVRLVVHAEEFPNSAKGPFVSINTLAGSGIIRDSERRDRKKSRKSETNERIFHDGQGKSLRSMDEKEERNKRERQLYTRSMPPWSHNNELLSPKGWNRKDQTTLHSSSGNITSETKRKEAVETNKELDDGEFRPGAGWEGKRSFGHLRHTTMLENWDCSGEREIGRVDPPLRMTVL